MKTITKKSFAEMVLLIVLGFTCCCVAACGSSNEEKKIKIEDTPLPVISNVKVSDVTSTSAKVSWETDKPAKGEIIWDLTNNITKESKSAVHEEFTTTHSFKITDLLPSTLYYYWTASVDAKGNWKVSEPSTFKTLAK